MVPCKTEVGFELLELPKEFEDLRGLVEADLQAIVSMLTERAHERLFLTRREHRQLQAELWNSLTGSLQEVLKPLDVELR